MEGVSLEGEGRERSCSGVFKEKREFWLREMPVNERVDRVRVPVERTMREFDKAFPSVSVHLKRMKERMKE